jgi:PilZ domain
MTAMLSTTVDGDRRRHPRQILQRPCKVFDPRGRRYLNAQTSDISGGGALIDLPRLIDLRPGDKVYLGIALKRRDQFLRADEMLESHVVRAVQTVDDHTALAVEFRMPQEQVDATSLEPLRIAA